MFTGTLALSGVTEIDTSADEATIRVVVVLTDPNCTEIVVEPAACPVAKPNAEIVATVGSEEVHCASRFKFNVVNVVPSL
jgi:hypothetical protein